MDNANTKQREAVATVEAGGEIPVRGFSLISRDLIALSDEGAKYLQRLLQILFADSSFSSPEICSAEFPDLARDQISFLRFRFADAFPFYTLLFS